MRDNALADKNKYKRSKFMITVMLTYHKSL